MRLFIGKWGKQPAEAGLQTFSSNFHTEPIVSQAGMVDSTKVSKGDVCTMPIFDEGTEWVNL